MQEPMNLAWMTQHLRTQYLPQFSSFLPIKLDEPPTPYKLHFTFFSPYCFYLPTLYLVMAKLLPFSETFLLHG
jgi:hypothetical protein